MKHPLPVFLVEDSHSMQSLLKELLASVGGFEVIGTADGETNATDWLYRNRQAWSVAILDLLLQEGSGYGLIRRCRLEHPGGTIIVYSEFATPVLAQTFIAMGANAVFRKSELKEFIAYLEGLARDGPRTTGHRKHLTYTIWEHRQKHPNPQPILCTWTRTDTSHRKTSGLTRDCLCLPASNS